MLNHCGEIDLIAQEKKELVFVEVRYRSNTHYGGPLASIDRKKQNKIKKTAQIYLRDNFANPPACRFDTLTFTSLEQEPKWVINAFC